jgi:hypothetical protein
MKRLSSLLAVFVMFGLIAACGTDDAGAGRGYNSDNSDTGVGGDSGGIDDSGDDAQVEDVGTDSTTPDSGSGDACTGPGCGSSGDLCASDEDCTAPEICTVDRSGDSLELSCQNPTGSGQLGDSCTVDSDCASNLCFNNECSEPCERPSDCSDDGSFICESSTVPTDTGADEDANICIRRPTSECASNADCTSPEQCIATKTATEVVFTCGSPNSGGGAVGESCTVDDDCEQNLCQGGTCSAPCAADGDCSAGDGFSCEIESVDLGNGESENAQVCTAPRACTSQRDCRIGEVCHLDRTTGDSTCRQPNAAGGELGDRCTGDVSCAANLCNEERFGEVCTVACDDDSDCPKTGYECGSSTIDDGSGGTNDMSVCIAKDPPACTSNDDCASGLNCAVVPNSAQNALETVCIPTSGGSATGVDCSVDEDCASLVCLNDTCSVPCADTTQCAGGQLCQSNDVTKEGLNGNFDMCETLPDERCDQTGTCSDGVRMCNEIRLDSSGTGREAYCGMTNPGAAGGLGDHCAQPPECRSDMCLAGLSDECTVICTTDSQCGTGQICTTFSLDGTQLGYCVSACSDNNDCAGLEFTNSSGDTIDHVCSFNTNTRDNDVDQMCVRRNIVDPNDSTIGLLGDDCEGTNNDAENSMCQSGMCLTHDAPTGTACSDASGCTTGQVCKVPKGGGTKQCHDRTFGCSRVCDDNGDCSGGISGNLMTECASDITYAGTHQVSACALPN